MSKNKIAELLERLFIQSKIRFGSAVKSRWFHDGDSCPGCGREIDAVKYKGKEAVSLNVFIFREHGVLIGYLLCGKCGKKVIKATSNTPLHAVIEQTLKQAYLRHLGH